MTINDKWIDDQADSASDFDRKDGLTTVNQYQYFKIPIEDIRNMDKMAEYVSAGAVIIGQKIPKGSRYWGERFPKGSVSRSNYYHATFIPFGVTLDGKDYLVSVDSSNRGKDDWIRLLDDSWLRDNVYQAYLVTYAVREQEEEEEPTSPVVKCKYGDTSDAVIILQNYLKAKGYLSLAVKSSGNYLDLTRKAVLLWQLDNITGVSHSQLREWNGKYWGDLSIKSLNDT